MEEKFNRDKSIEVWGWSMSGLCISVGESEKCELLEEKVRAVRGKVRAGCGKSALWNVL